MRKIRKIKNRTFKKPFNLPYFMPNYDAMNMYMNKGISVADSIMSVQPLVDPLKTIYYRTLKSRSNKKNNIPISNLCQEIILAETRPEYEIQLEKYQMILMYPNDKRKKARAFRKMKRLYNEYPHLAL